jgi:murein DD-endopeptidase MepM/ murein hydrolase activator NlpD
VIPALLVSSLVLVLTAVVPGTPSRAWLSQPSPVPAGSPRDVPARGAPTANGFRWPLDGVPRVVRPFDPPPEPWQRGHRGVDLAGPVGVTVRAAGPGTVLFAGMIANRPVVSVSHQNGLRTTYEPVRPVVAAGDRVAAGQPLGVLLAGHPGCLAGPPACLHWGLRRGEEYLDPLLLLGLGRVRLLPIPPGNGTRPAAHPRRPDGPGTAPAPRA